MSSHESAAIVDSHSDLLLELVHRRHERNPFHTYWLTNLRRGGVTCQVCALYVDREYLPEAGLRRALHQVVAFHRAVRENDEKVAAVIDASGLEDALESHKIALLLAIEGLDVLGFDIDLVDVLLDLGVRMVALTWNRRNAFADGAESGDGTGLTKLGEELVDLLVDRPVVLDLAHASGQTFNQVLERVPSGRVVVSHGACRALCDTPRNLSDEQLRQLAEHGGVLGLMAHPFVIDPTQPTIERFVDHLDHAIDVMGPDHVGLGGDFICQVHRAVVVSADGVLLPNGMAMDAVIPGLEGPEHYGSLVAALRRRGYPEDVEAGVLHRNFVRAFQRSLAPA